MRPWEPIAGREYAYHGAAGPCVNASVVLAGDDALPSDEPGRARRSGGGASPAARPARACSSEAGRGSATRWS